MCIVPLLPDHHVPTDRGLAHAHVYVRWPAHGPRVTYAKLSLWCSGHGWPVLQSDTVVFARQLDGC